MSGQAIHWYEGMFLRPQHFQATQRHLLDVAGRGDKWDLHYNWGLRAIELDLGQHRLAIRRLKARLPGGTLVAVPEDGCLPEVDLKTALRRQPSVTAYLAVPRLQSSRANINPANSPNGARYLVDTQQLEDENTGLNPATVEVRRLNLKLFLSSEEPGDLEALPLARFMKPDRPGGGPQLDESYIPPLLACDAWKPLVEHRLGQLCRRLGETLDRLASQVITQNLTFDSQAPGARQLLELLRVLNETYAPLSVAVAAEGIHPLTVYGELCRLVGRLAIFRAQRRVPELPKYDHGNLGVCFGRIEQYINDLLDSDIGV
jgi:type VI secretion system protein ImpJ